MSTRANGNKFTIMLCTLQSLNNYWNGARYRLGLATAYIEKGKSADALPEMIEDDLAFFNARENMHYTILIDAVNKEACHFVFNLLETGEIDEVILLSEGSETEPFTTVERFETWYKESLEAIVDIYGVKK